MDIKTLWALGAAAGLMLIGAWPDSPATFLAFVALVPLIVAAEKAATGRQYFGALFIGFLVFNAGTTWWIWNSTAAGCIGAIVANSLLMCLPWLGFHALLKKHGRNIGHAALVVFWMTFEYVHLNWQLSWPWLSLGNVFAFRTEWVQWYEYTGAAGGTLWALLSNLAVRNAIGKWVVRGKANLLSSTGWAFIVGPPILVSYQMLSTVKPMPMPSGNLIVVQGNIDPYKKFDAATAATEAAHLVSLSESAMDSATQLVVWPETALSFASWQHDLEAHPDFGPVSAFLARHPATSLLTGMETIKDHGTVKATATARQNSSGRYCDVYNSAVLFQKGKAPSIYNKSRLVPGVETVPSFLDFLAPLFEHFGGTTGGYGKDDSSKAMAIDNGPYVAAPVICYESIYGEYVASYVRRGANIIAIMTNDGWWGNTPGHRQHLRYARLRAIECRRWVARSANTGISAIIDGHGNIIGARGWDKTGCIKYPVPVSTGTTFYVLFGDYLYKICLGLAGLLSLWHFAGRIRGRKA